MYVLLDADLNFPSDDFEALLLLSASERMKIVGCSATAGNTWMEEVWLNIRGALDLIGASDVPVAKGKASYSSAAQRSWALERRSKGINPFVGAFEKGNQPRVSPEKAGLVTSAPIMLDLVRGLNSQYGNRLHIMATGPLTNLATAFKQDPSLVHQLDGVTAMGGYFGPDAATHRPDFNIWFDPDAARTVFAAGADFRLVPLDVCRAVRSDPVLLEVLTAHRSGWARYFGDDFAGMSAQHGLGMPLYDQLVAAICIDSALVLEERRGHVEVDWGDGESRGRTRFIPHEGGNVRLVTKADRSGVHSLIKDLVAKMAHRQSLPDSPAWLGRVL